MITVVIPVKDKVSLPRIVSHYRSIPVVQSIIIADGNPQNPASIAARSLLKEFTDKYVYIPSEHFNKSRSINIAASLVETSYMLINDADVMINVSSVEEMLSLAERGNIASLLQVTEEADGVIREGPGMVCLGSELFRRLDGYDGNYNGWGFEDRDFLWRATASGFSVIATGSGVHISHDDREREQNYAEGRTITRARNMNRLQMKQERNIFTGTYNTDCFRAD